MKIMVMTGSLDSVWTKGFIEKVLIPMEHEIYVQENPAEAGRFAEFYQKNGVNAICHYKVNKSLVKIPKFGKWYGFYQRYYALDKSVKFDYIICLFVTPFFLKCAQKMTSANTKIIAWFIGSDLLRAKNSSIKKLALLIEKLNVFSICVTEKINEKYKKSIDPNGANAVIDFGISQIEQINELAKLEENQKKYFLKIEEDYITIAIGYNGSPAQQHLKVIDSIKKISGISFEKICLVLPMTYQKHACYMKKVKKHLDSMGMKYIVLEKFLDSEEMARLWLSVDIFIHAQTSDALSASMLECLYAGCAVFNGSWLKYEELDDWGIEYNQFENFEELTVLLKEKIGLSESNTNKNNEAIWKYASWETCVKKWEGILK